MGRIILIGAMADGERLDTLLAVDNHPREFVQGATMNVRSWLRCGRSLRRSLSRSTVTCQKPHYTSACPRKLPNVHYLPSESLTEGLRWRVARRCRLARSSTVPIAWMVA